MKYIVVDLEMNGVAEKYWTIKDMCHLEIIQIGAIMLDENYEEISSFNKYCKPVYNDEISKNYEYLTGITTETVAFAPLFETVFKEFVDWCASKEPDYRIYAWSNSDLLQVKTEMKVKNMVASEAEEYALNNWHDFQKEFDDLIGVSSAVSLNKALAYAGETFTGKAHNALTDARNTAKLMKLVSDEENFKKTIKITEDVLKPSGPTTLGDMIDFSSFLSK